MRPKTDNREDYLINILRLYDGSNPVKTNDIAKLMSVAPASVTEMLNVLQCEGLVDYERYKGVTLTPLGLKTAKELRRKHHIFEKFLIDVLDIDPESAHTEACAFEHAISDEAADRLCKVIGNIEDDYCEYCSKPCSRHGDKQHLSTRLADAKVGRYVVSYIYSDDTQCVKKLMNLGIIPGKEIEVAESGDNAIIKVGGKSIVLDGLLASSVFLDQR